MRWFKKPGIKTGTVRTTVKFAWWPITIKGETRWMEWVAVKQRFIRDGCMEYTWIGWMNLDFDDEYLRHYRERKLLEGA